MNFVSVLVYLADVLGTLNLILNMGVGLTIIPFIFGFIMWSTQENGRMDRDIWDAAMKRHREYPRAYDPPQGNRPDLKNIDPIWKFIKKPVALLIGVIILASIVPNPNTVYAIAASEAAENVLESPTVSKAVDALNRWLDKQAR